MRVVMYNLIFFFFSLLWRGRSSAGQVEKGGCAHRCTAAAVLRKSKDGEEYLEEGSSFLGKKLLF